MSLQDDYFDLEHYLNEQVRREKKGTPERSKAEAARLSHRMIWSAFCEMENENEKLRPVVSAVTTIVRHVIETHYQNGEVE